jgi:hypothetical protein
MSDDPLVYGIFCRSSHGYHKWIWIRREPKTIKSALEMVRFPCMRFTYHGFKPRRAKPVPLSWFKKELEQQESLGYVCEPIYPHNVRHYTQSVINRRDEMNATK